MSLILILGDRFSGEAQLAESLAERLGYTLVSAVVVVERAAAWGKSQQELAHFLEDSPGPFGRFLRKTRSHFLLLRAAVAEEVRNGNAVCCGEAAHLLLQERIPMIRVRVCASFESRVRTVSRVLKLAVGEAAAHLKRADRARNKWLREAYGREHNEPASDIIIDLDCISLPEAGERIAALVRQSAQGPSDSSAEVLLEGLAVSSRVEAALATDPATAHLELAVESDRGRVSIRGCVGEPEGPIEVHRVARGVRGVSEVRLNGEELARLQAPDHRWFIWRGARLAFVTLGLTLVAVLLFGEVAHRFGSSLEEAVLARWGGGSQTIVGLVTDSRCGPRHQGTDNAECVRACVAQGAKYVLDDGKKLYELSDQLTARAYAAREVRVRGSFVKKSGYLAVDSMVPL